MASDPQSVHGFLSDQTMVGLHRIERRVVQPLNDIPRFAVLLSSLEVLHEAVQSARSEREGLPGVALEGPRILASIGVEQGLVDKGVSQIHKEFLYVVRAKRLELVHALTEPILDLRFEQRWWQFIRFSAHRVHKAEEPILLVEYHLVDVHPVPLDFQDTAHRFKLAR